MSCIKIPYPTRKEAIATLLKIDRERDENRRERCCYFCRSCQNWHLSSEMPRNWSKPRPFVLSEVKTNAT